MSVCVCVHSLFISGVQVVCCKYLLLCVCVCVHARVWFQFTLACSIISCRLWQLLEISCSCLSHHIIKSDTLEECVSTCMCVRLCLYISCALLRPRTDSMIAAGCERFLLYCVRRQSVARPCRRYRFVIGGFCWKAEHLLYCYCCYAALTLCNEGCKSVALRWSEAHMPVLLILNGEALFYHPRLNTVRVQMPSILGPFPDCRFHKPNYMKPYKALTAAVVDLADLR